VRPHGARELAHAEPDFFVAGMKSYGRAPTFLLATGHEQVRSIAAALAGDHAAAARVELELPETGVCSAPPALRGLEGEGSCCAPDPAVVAPGCCASAPPKVESACCAPAPAKVEAGCCAPAPAKGEAGSCAPAPAKVESGCCAPAPVKVESGCCAPATAPTKAAATACCGPRQEAVA
jgi:hypothetical protein